MDFNFKGRDIINGYDFTTQELCHIMDTAMIYEKRVKSGEAIKDMEGMLVATLFFEPSTRTRLSFNSAIQRMGASTIDLGSASASSQCSKSHHQNLQSVYQSKGICNPRYLLLTTRETFVY